LVDAGAGYDDTVRRSKNASLVGASGIVVQETENTFKVVTRKDKLKGARLPPLFCYVCPQFFFTVLPKQGSVFAFAVPLYGTESESESSRSASAAALAATGSGTNSGANGRGAADGDADADAGADDARETRTVLDGPHIEFELYGNQFCFRAADRAGRKFKHKETIEL
jgi:ribonuclease P protein subunit POP4